MSRKVDQNFRIIKNLKLKRKYHYQGWGFTITGGWQEGQWIGKLFENKHIRK